MLRAYPTPCAPSGRKCLATVLVAGSVLLVMSVTFAFAQDVSARPPDVRPPLTLSKVFIFVFLTLGPFNVVGPFANMTRGRDTAFKRRLAVEGTSIAALGLLVAATLGANALTFWGVSASALFITTGILLFLVGLRFVRAQYQ